MKNALARKALGPADDVETRVHAHLPLVRRLAWHVHGKVSSGSELEDLIQAGMVALVEAAQTFEDRGFAFSTYASMRIRGAMIDLLRRSSGQSRRAAAARRAIQSSRQAIESGSPLRATATEIAAKMNVSLDDYYRLESDAASGATDSLESMYADENIAFRDDGEDQDFILDRKISEGRLQEALETLDDRERLVLNLYFFEEMNLQEIADVLEVSAPRVCQIKKSAFRSLREAMEPA